jgi:hypothetical protein
LTLDDDARNRLRTQALAFARSRFDHRDSVRGFLAEFLPSALVRP